MFHGLTVFYVILYLVVVTAQVDEDLEADYSDTNQAYNEENLEYGDYNVTYGDDYDTYGDGYDKNGDEIGENDYSDYDLATISFSMDKFKEFYSCLCLGSYQECEIHYSQEGDAMIVNLIAKTGSLQGESDLCKYYMCAHVSDTLKISCVQAKKRSTACNFGAVAQFFRLKSYDCCKSACVGLFWSSAEEQMSFFQNSSDVESCNDTCMCSSKGEKETRITKVTVSPLSNETQIDTYIIHKTQSTPDFSSTKTSSEVTVPSKVTNNLPSVSLKVWRSSTPSSVNADLLYGGRNDSNTTNFEDNENNKTITIMVATVAVISFAAVFICVVVAIVVVCRRKRQRNMRMNVNNNKTSDTGSGHGLTAEPALSYFRHAKVNETSPTIYSKHPTEAATDINVYEQSPKVSGISKNGVKSQDSTDIGNGDSSSLARESVHLKSVLATETNRVAVSNLTGSGQPRKVDVDTEHNQADIRHGHNSKKSGNIKGGFDSGNKRFNDNSDLDYSESDGFINGRSNADSAGQIRRNQGGKNSTNSKVKEDVKSKQPLLTWPPVKESVV